MIPKKRIGIIAIVCVFAVAIVLTIFIASGVSKRNQERNIEIAKGEMLSACEESFADIYSQADCVRYGLVDFKYELLDCVNEKDDFNRSQYYLVSLRVDCTTETDINKTEMALIGHAVNDLLPEGFVSSVGTYVSVEVRNYEHEYALEDMVYVYVNGELTRSPESTANSESTEGLACPNCGTAFRYDTAGFNMIQERGYCNVCNGRGND